MIAFCYLEKNEFDKYATNLFADYYDNMNKIAPTGNSPEDDFNSWYNAVKMELQNDKRHMIIIYIKETNEIIGFFRYYIDDFTFMMEEINIKASYQGKYHIFRRLYGFLLEHLTEEIRFVEAYTNKKNEKTISILNKMGLSIIGENKNGISYRFRGIYGKLLEWYKKPFLRHFTEDDAEIFQKKHSKQLSLEEIREVFQKWSKKEYDGRYFEMFAILQGEQIVGSISLYQHSESVVSCGSEIFEDYHRQGFATESMVIAMNIAKDKGYKIVCQQIRVDNVASIALHNKLGFETDGYVYKNKKGNDVLIYLKVLV